MQVEYQHANPHDGRDSTLVRFHDEIQDQTTCILIDAGDAVDVDELLRDDEYLNAILLTHAHLDHYRTLGENLQDGAPIIATPETAVTLTSRLDTEADHAKLDRPDEIADALTPTDGWTPVSPDVRVHPVPAGHAPGACGFLVEFEDGDDTHQLLATGDFTTTRAAGYPGLPTDRGVDAVFLTGASRDDASAALTDAVATALDRAMNGSTVLTTASGLTGVHLAYLLGHLCDRAGVAHPVTLAGRVATLWEALDYEHPHVEAVPTFEETESLLAAGKITIAGPEVPVSGSSERLFAEIEDDAGATLLQVTSGAFDSEESASCTVYTVEFSNHPPDSTIDAVVESLDPIHVVITHQQGPNADRYKDKYDSFVWATDDYNYYTLYDDGDWIGPPWVTDATHRRVRSKLFGEGGTTFGATLDTTDLPLPSVERRDDVDLEAEGIDLSRVASEIGIDEKTLRGTAAPETAVATEESADTESAEQVSSLEEADSVKASDDHAETLQEVLRRLERLEALLDGQRTTATVVDAGDDVTLLRLDDEALGAQFTHGDSIELSLAGHHDDLSSESNERTNGQDQPE